MYFIDSLASPYCYAGAMICRLFGVSYSARFSIEMEPLMEAAIHSYIMDWATILSNKMANQILYYRINRFVTTRIIPPFYMSAYIMDTICFNSDHPILGWKWTPQGPTPIEIYHKYLWKALYKDHIYRIYHGFFYPSIRPYSTTLLLGYLMRPTSTLYQSTIGSVKKSSPMPDFLAPP